MQSEIDGLDETEGASDELVAKLEDWTDGTRRQRTLTSAAACVLGAELKLMGLVSEDANDEFWVDLVDWADGTGRQSTRWA